MNNMQYPRNRAVSEYKVRAKARLKNLKASYRRTNDPELKKKRRAQITMLQRELGIKEK